MLIDTHCHLNDANAFPDPAATVEMAREAGVERLIVIGTHPEDWTSAIALSERFAGVFVVVGWHPNRTDNYDPSSLSLLESLLRHPKVLALGEIGLDYHWDFAPRENQFRALHDQLDLAVRANVPVVFHAREAYADLLNVLEARSAHPYLFHCFAGNLDEAQRATALDAYFGVDGPVTYPKAEELRSVLRQVPPERLLLETDSPYMSPVPYRGKPNQPAHVRHVCEGLAKACGKTPEEMADLTTANAVRFFGRRLVDVPSGD